MKQLFKIMTIFFLLFGCSENYKSAFYAYNNSTIPVVLGKSTLSSNAIEWNNVYIPKTKEIFFTKMGENASKIMVRKYNDSTFTEAIKINFPDKSSHSDVYVSSESNLMLYGDWQSPEPFFSKNIEGNQFYPWLTNSGNLYFAITPLGSQNSDLYVSEYKNEQYQIPRALPKHINSEKLEGDPYVSPDESFLIFAGFEREQNQGKSDLYISFRQKDNWSSPIWLGEEINSEGYDGSPFVTEDGEFLIFTSSRGSTDDNIFFNHYIVKFNIKKWKPSK
jgi:hypothetical protein